MRRAPRASSTIHALRASRASPPALIQAYSLVNARDHGIRGGAYLQRTPHPKTPRTPRWCEAPQRSYSTQQKRLGENSRTQIAPCFVKYSDRET